MQQSTQNTTQSDKLRAQAQARQKAYRERAKKSGLKRVPTGYMQPDVSSMIDALIAQGYASSINAVLHRAVRDVFSAKG